MVEKKQLTVKEIHTLLTKECKESISYQAVHKSIKELIRQEILNKQGKKISVEKNWVEKIKRFAEKLEETYLKSKIEMKIVQLGKNTISYTFNNLSDLNKTWLNLHKKKIRESRRKDRLPNVWVGAHCWWVIGLIESEDSLVKELKKHKIHMYWACNRNTKLDKWTSKYYKGPYLHFKNSKNLDKTAKYILVIDDYVFECKYPKELTNKLEKFYTKTRSHSNLNLKKLMKIIKEKRKVSFLVIKNPLLAEQLRTSIIKEFKGR